MNHHYEMDDEEIEIFEFQKRHPIVFSNTLELKKNKDFSKKESELFKNIETCISLIKDNELRETIEYFVVELNYPLYDDNLSVSEYNENAVYNIDIWESIIREMQSSQIKLEESCTDFFDETISKIRSMLKILKSLKI